MKVNLYSIYDTVACIFNKPFTEVNDATAIRTFQNSITESPNLTDYDLYYLGEYDDSNGIINGTIDLPGPKKIRAGFDLAASQATEIPEILKKQSADR